MHIKFLKDVKALQVHPGDGKTPVVQDFAANDEAELLHGVAMAQINLGNAEEVKPTPVAS